MVNRFKNQRNAAAGALALLDMKEVKARKLSFIVWDIISLENEYKSYHDKLWTAWQQFGFMIVPYDILTKKADASKIQEAIDHCMEMAEKIGCPCDGVVFKYNNIEYGESLGATAHHFRDAIAWKPAIQTYSSRLRYIDWTMGRTGVLTPVAVFDPIEIDGAEVSRASLHNVSIMKETLGDCAYVGEPVEVYKSNMIIPQIYSAGPKYDYGEVIAKGGVSANDAPEYCPICHGEISFKEENGITRAYCENPNCSGKLINRLDHFCSKKGLDIKGLSKVTVEKLINWGWINSVSDIYKLQQWKKEWENKPGFGTKSVSNILQSISESTNCNLESVIAAAGIPLIGRTVAKDISAKFPTYNQFREAIKGNFDFSELNNFGYEMNKSLKNFDYTELDYIVENFLTIKENKQENKQQKLKGLTFCITGKLINKDKWKNRDELSTFITSLGGKVVGAVSPHIDYLINNDINSTSAKNNKAKELGKQIIDEQTFIDMFDL